MHLENFNSSSVAISLGLIIYHLVFCILETTGQDFTNWIQPKNANISAGIFIALNFIFTVLVPAFIEMGLRPYVYYEAVLSVIIPAILCTLIYLIKKHTKAIVINGTDSAY